MRFTRGFLRWEVESGAPGAVLILTTAWPSPDEPARGVFVHRQVNALQGRGIAVDVLHLRGSISRSAYLAAGLELRFGEAASRDYRLVHAQSGEAATVAWLHPRAPVLTTYFGTDILGRSDAYARVSRASQLRAAVLRRTAALSVATITQSEEMHNVLPIRLARRDSILLNGVDLSRFTPIDRAKARSMLGWSQEGRVALFVATQPTVPLKRHWLAVAAVGRARSSLADLRLETASGISPDRMPLLMSAADCLLHTSASEGSPNVVKEAMACNLPVVATDVGDVTQLLRDVRPSRVCEPDESVLAEALVNCLQHTPRSNGRAYAHRYDEVAMIDQLIRLYDTIAHDSRELRMQTPPSPSSDHPRSETSEPVAPAPGGP
jgi:glycosyltransferase involved in cell wall biosynthesis